MGRILQPYRKGTSRRVSAGILLLCLMLPLGAAHAGLLPRGSRQRREIEHLEQQYRQAMLNGDIVMMRRMLADSYIGIEPNGIIKTKNETLADWEHHRVTMQRLDLSDVRVRIFGDTAVVTSRAFVIGRGPYGPIHGEFRYTRVYHRERTGRWQIVSFEANRIREHRRPGRR